MCVCLDTRLLRVDMSPILNVWKQLLMCYASNLHTVVLLSTAALGKMVDCITGVETCLLVYRFHAMNDIITSASPCLRQITTPAPHHSTFTGRMPFLPTNQQHQSTEATRPRFTLCLAAYQTDWSKVLCIMCPCEAACDVVQFATQGSLRAESGFCLWLQSCLG